MAEAIYDYKVEGVPKESAAPLAANYLNTNERVASGDRIKSEMELSNRLINQDQVTLGLVGDAKDLFPQLPLEQGLVNALEIGKEDVAKEQKRQKDAGMNPPPLGKMMVDSGLVTQKQVDDALAEQAKLKAEGKTAPRIGDILVQQLKDNIARAVAEQNHKK